MDNLKLNILNKIAVGIPLRTKERMTVLIRFGLLLFIFVPVGTAAVGSENEPNLIDLAIERFDKLMKVEEKLFEAVVKSEVADYSADNERVLRADRIAWLCTDLQASELVTHRGIWVKGAHIKGKLDLAFAKISFPLRFEKCKFKRNINLEQANLYALDFSGTHTHSIDANRLTVEGDVRFCNDFKAKGMVNLIGAKIGGYLDCAGGKFINKTKRGSEHENKAIEATGVKVDGNVRFSNGFESKGTVSLYGATIGRELDCKGGKFTNPGWVAFNGDQVQVKGCVFLSQGFEAEGQVCLIGATIGRDLDCTNGKFIIPDKKVTARKNTEEGFGEALKAPGLRVGGNVYLRNCFEAKGTVELIGATIGGYLDCSGGKFINRERSNAKGIVEMKGESDRENVALEATGVSVGGNVSFGKGFAAVGVVSLYGAKISRDLDCKGGTFINPGWVAFNGDQMEVQGCVFQSRKEYSGDPNERFKAHGQVRLIGASIGGDLDCTKGEFITRTKTADDVNERHEFRWVALKASRATVKGDVLLRTGFKAVGMVELKGATIDGYFDCSGGRFVNRKCSNADGIVEIKDANDRGNVALEATGVKVGGNVNFGKKFEAVGVVSLYGATIGRELDCKGGTFNNPGWVAFNGDQMEVHGSVFQSRKEYSRDPNEHFKARGQVRLIGASIGGDLDCRGGKLTHPDPHEPCLYAEMVKVGRDVWLSEKFHATGKVSLASAAIDGYLYWENVNEPNDVSELDLESANIGTIHIDPCDANWPQRVILYGLEYGEINEQLAESYDLLIGWLNRQYHDGRSKAATDNDRRELHSPQPYEQLAAVLSKGGDADMARKVLVEMNKDRCKYQPNLSFWRRWLWYRTLGPMIDYGYNPLKVFYMGPFGCPFFGTIPFWLIVGGIFFKIGKGKGKDPQLITPSNLRAYDEKGELNKIYPKFNSFVYTLDLFLPLIDLHQASYWEPNANAERVLFEGKKCEFSVSGSELRWYMWIHICLGWILTMLLVAGLTGLVRT